MRTIWKFRIEVADEVSLVMPDVVRWLPRVEVEPVTSRVLELWAVVDSDTPQVERLLHVRGTGHPMGVADPSGYIGTAIDHQHGLVWHVFDGGKAKAGA